MRVHLDHGSALYRGITYTMVLDYHFVHMLDHQLRCSWRVAP